MTEVIEPLSISELSQSQLESLILGIRQRRDRVAKLRSIAHHRSRNTDDGIMALRLAKMAQRLDRALIKLDTDITRAEALAMQVIAIRLEHGDATVDSAATELSRDAGPFAFSGDQLGSEQGSDSEDEPRGNNVESVA